jgi:hypothetical protein
MPQNQGNGPIRLVNTLTRVSLSCSLLFILLISAASGLAQTTEPEEEPDAPAATEPASEATATTPTETTPRNMRAKELLADALADESHWLETSEGKILVLYRRTEAKTTKGALLLLHAAEDPQVWPPALENLRKRLPQYGWETLAITLPQKYPPIAPARDTDSEEGNDVENDEEATIDEETTTEEPTAPSEPDASNSPAAVSQTAPAREQLIKAYLLAALGFLNEKGQFNLVVLVDNSSFYWCMQLLSPSIKTNQIDPNTVDGPLQALVITNLQAQEPLLIHELEASFNQPQLPILDIFFAPDDTEQKLQRDLHKTAAMRNKLDYYQQLSLEQQPKIIEADAASFLVARVRGFMEKKAKGTEVKLKK